MRIAQRLDYHQFHVKTKNYKSGTTKLWIEFSDEIVRVASGKLATTMCTFFFARGLLCSYGVLLPRHYLIIARVFRMVANV